MDLEREPIPAPTLPMTLFVVLQARAGVLLRSMEARTRTADQDREEGGPKGASPRKFRYSSLAAFHGGMRACFARMRRQWNPLRR